jgi:hypothetical protein
MHKTPSQIHIGFVQHNVTLHGLKQASKQASDLLTVPNKPHSMLGFRTHTTLRLRSVFDLFKLAVPTV